MNRFTLYEQMMISRVGVESPFCSRYPFGFWYDGEEEEKAQVRNGRMARALTEEDMFNNRLYNVLGKWVRIKAFADFWQPQK